MCGIAGIRTFDGEPVALAALRSMTAPIAHRGPDAQGQWISDDATIGFGHRRLSIIDLAGSPQPMTSPDEKLVVTFNGEIENYQALRPGLTYPWRTNGDTEVLLAGFREHGPKFVTQLRGQFAFALYDTRQRDLWLYRDRLGIIPLYWYADDQFFAFASEPKALLPVLPKPPAVDDAALVDFLGHRSVPAPNTLFRGIKKLRPGHRLRVAADGTITETSYWEVPNEPTRAIDPRAAVELVDDAIRDAVRTALVADVPVGSYLSGGVDSSLIAAIAVELRDGEPLDTFSANFVGDTLDEAPYARTVSDHLTTRHHEVTIDPGTFARSWPALTRFFDSPVPEPPDVALASLARSAREHVRVVLSGEGSDELFGGYPKYRWARAVEKFDRLPNRVRMEGLRHLERALPARANRIRTLIRAAGASYEAERFRAWFAPFNAPERLALTGATGGDTYDEIWRRAHDDLDLLERMRYVDLHVWLSDNLLERGDRTAMSASLELRPPLLDHALVELACTLPSSVMLRDNTTKWVLREVARRYVPVEIVDRPKHGFKVPLDSWFRGPLAGWSRELLLERDAFVGSVLDRATVSALLKGHVSGRHNDGLRIFTLVSLELWHRAYFTH